MSQSYYKPKQASKTQSYNEHKDYSRKPDYQEFDENRGYQPRNDQRKVNHTKEFNQERPLSSKDPQRQYHDKYPQGEKEGSHPSERNYDNNYNQKRNLNKNQENQGKTNRNYEFEYIKREERKHEGTNNEHRTYHGKNNQNQNKGQETQNKKKVTFDLSQDKPNNNNHQKQKDVEVVYYVKKEQNSEEKSAPVEEHKNERKKKNYNRNKYSDENVNNKAEKVEIIEQENKGEQIVKTEDNINTKNDKDKADSIPQDKKEKVENRVTSLMNKRDDPSPSASKPFLGNNSYINITSSLEAEKDQSSLISDTESTTSKQALSTPNNPQPINHTQTQNEQSRMMYAPGFNGLQMPAIFQTPYIVFPQPNGTSIIQPLYQYPLMNMGPRNPEDEQLRQPFYLVSSHLLPTPENQSRDNFQPMPMAQTNLQFSFPQMQPMFLNPLIGNSMPIQTQQASERDFHKSVVSDTPSKDETLSDRRDD